MPNAAIIRPFRKRNLAEQHQLEPVGRHARARTHSYGFPAAQNWRLHSDFREARGQHASAMHRKACTDFAGVPQRAMLLISEVKGAQRALALARIATTNDDELLPP